MPAVVRQDGFDVRIYTNDHIPSHVHVVKAKEEVVIDLGDENNAPEVRENRGMKNKNMRRALEIVNEHQTELLAEWRRIHG